MKEKQRPPDNTAAQIEARENILNSLNIPVYVSDLATNEILYANAALRRTHGDEPLTGRVCWEALRNETKRCEFCPIPYLLKNPGKDYQREIYNRKHLKIYDSLIPWENGKLAHLQYVVDITKGYL